LFSRTTRPQSAIYALRKLPNSSAAARLPKAAEAPGEFYATSGTPSSTCQARLIKARDGAHSDVLQRVMDQNTRLPLT
jgi:hypothetical protein